MEQDVLERKHVSRRGFLAGTGALVSRSAAPRLVNPRAAFATLAGTSRSGRRRSTRLRSTRGSRSAATAS
jgi:hypothetical protein